MELLLPEIKRIAERLRDSEEKRRQLADFLKSSNNTLGLVKDVAAGQHPDKQILVGIDGGIVRKALHGFDFILVRAAGVCFEYKSGRVEKASYFPSKFPQPHVFTMESVSEIDYAYYASIIRQKMEIEAARRSLEKFKPDMLFLDGSIVPHYTTKPSASSIAYGEYERLMEAYQMLYRECSEANTLLAGVVEDSRGERFCNIVKEKVASEMGAEKMQNEFPIITKTRDTNLLYWMLDKGQRTATFDYAPDMADHPILKDFVLPDGSGLFSFYLKTAKWDRPVRVDFLDRAAEDKLASTILAISGQNSSYGFPSILIEADSVARMSEQEVENFYSYILKYAGNIPSVMKLRREQRPF